jgi:hypothetical protein
MSSNGTSLVLRNTEPYRSRNMRVDLSALMVRLLENKTIIRLIATKIHAPSLSRTKVQSPVAENESFLKEHPRPSHHIRVFVDELIVILRFHVLLSHRYETFRRVVTRDVVKQLPLNIGQQTACTKSEHVRHQPLVTEFFLYQRLPRHGLFGGINSACGLEADLVTEALQILTDGAHHHQADFQRGIDRFLARRDLEKVRII